MIEVILASYDKTPESCRGASCCKMDNSALKRRVEKDQKGMLIESKRKAYNSIDEYIADFPEGIQKILNELRAVIKAAAPDAQERISYQMPTFSQNGNLVHFAAYQHHIGFYPTPSGIEKFKRELSAYEGSKGAIRFPIDQSLPFELISQIVAFRVKENLAKLPKKR